MNKKILTTILAITIAAIVFGYFFTKDKTNSDNIPGRADVSSFAKDSTGPISKAQVPADKIEVVHFHGTHQCWSCITVGEYALKTIKEKFPDEYASKKIIFKDINGELSENQEMVNKFQARGSSLFINSVRSKKDNIEEDINVWRLIANENQFVSYFENKLNSLLGK